MKIEYRSNRERQDCDPSMYDLIAGGYTVMFHVTLSEAERIGELLKSGDFEDSEAWEIAENIRKKYFTESEGRWELLPGKTPRYIPGNTWQE